MAIAARQTIAWTHRERRVILGRNRGRVDPSCSFPLPSRLLAIGVGDSQGEGSMTPFRAVRVRAICAIAAILAFVGPVGCTADPVKPGAVAWRREKIEVANASVTLMLAKAASPSPPPFLVVFASGDGGLVGVSMALLQHLADRSYCVVGFSSEEAFAKVVAESGGRANYVAARDSLASIIAQAKHALELSERTPIIVTGVSRGASVVVASAGDPTLRSGILGAIAIALTREFDDLTIGEVAKPVPGVERDEQGRIQTYPAIERLRSVPLAIIQSTNDSYVPSVESRRLLGPDTPTRRLYEVESRNHSFEGGEDALMRDLDDAMKWIGRRAIVGAPGTP
jgi:hypothetical protein